MTDTASAQDRFLAAFDAYLDEAGVADALSAARRAKAKEGQSHD